MYGKDNARQSREQYIKTIYSFWTWSAQISMFNQNFTTSNIVSSVTLLEIERQDFFHKSFLQLLALLFILNNLYAWFFIKESKKHKSWLEDFMMMMSLSAVNQLIDFCWWCVSTRVQESAATGNLQGQVFLKNSK